MYTDITFFLTVINLKMEDINLDHVHETSSHLNLAVKITDAYKSYNSAAVVLNGFNMNVKKGTM